MSEADPKFGSALKEDWEFGPIFDADAHIDPPYEMWKDYLPQSQKHKAPVIEEGDEHDWLVFEGNRRPIHMMSNQAGRAGKDFKMKGKLSDMRNTHDPQKRIDDMDLDGIDQAILFGGGPLGSFDNDLYLASFEAFSRWVMDWAAIAPNRLFPVGHAPMRDIDETIEHVKRLARMGFKMLQLPAFPQNPEAWRTSSGVAALKEGQVSAQTGDPKGALQYYQPEFDRLWKVLCDHGMVITFHLGARVPRFRDKQHFLPDMPMSKVNMAEPLGIFIFNGIFERFPDLRIGSMESGVGWFAWYAEYCDRTWEKQRWWTDSVIDKLPSYYMDQNIWGSFIQDRAGIALRDFPGGRNQMWSSDYPHSETTFPNSHAVIRRDFAGVPIDTVQDISCNNAKRLLRIS
jgi:predicted TIM-barrel fold metal-dependent hydrolase